MPKEIGPRERQLQAMREEKQARLAGEMADVDRKERAALKSADAGAKLIERINEAAKKRGKPRKSRK